MAWKRNTLKYKNKKNLDLLFREKRELKMALKFL